MVADKKFVIRCRAIILHEGKLLLVRHPSDTSYAALPGGKLDWGEDVKECLKREVIEELGVEPILGRLLYINTFMDGENTQSIEFFFEIKNGSQYADTKKLTGTHAHELAEIVWIGSDSNIRILPTKIGEDFKAGKLLADEPRYIKG
jgi:ADP-ribose pyrophosphatase YjhB (NUDIX family)